MNIILQLFDQQFCETAKKNSKDDKSTAEDFVDAASPGSYGMLLATKNAISMSPNISETHQAATEAVHDQQASAHHAHDDEVKDSEQFEGSASCTDISCFIWGILTYMADIGTDMWLAYKYFNQRHYWWFSLTLGFLVVPTIIITVYSLVLYCMDWRIVGEKASPKRWVSRSLFLLLQLGLQEEEPIPWQS